MAYVKDVKQGCLVTPLRCVTLFTPSAIRFDRAASRIYILVSYYLRNILFILAWVNTMSHGREKRPHEMNARCERGGIAYLAICGRSRVIWRVTARTPWTLRTRVLHFLYLFSIYYPHNILIITNHHRIIIPKISHTIVNVLSNVSEVSAVEDCAPERLVYFR